MTEQIEKWEILKNQTGCANSSDVLDCLRSADEAKILGILE
jgi:hypothetical protein